MIFDAFKAVMAATVFVSLLNQPVSGQPVEGAGDTFTYAEQVKKYYGYDQSLINGILYYNRYVRCSGQPYLLGNDFKDGELTIHGRNYPGIKIRYDIISQYVELAYLNLQGKRNWLFTVSDHVEAFLLGEYQFLSLDLDGQSRKFYQVIRTDFFTCYVHWEKRLLPLQNDPQFTRKISDADGTFLLEMDGRTSVFKNRKTFSQLFPSEFQKEIRRLLRRNRLKLHLTNPDEMVRNMHAVADLLKNGGLS